MNNKEAILLFQNTVDCIDEGKQIKTVDWNIAQLKEMSKLAIVALRNQITTDEAYDQGVKDGMELVQ